MQARLLIINCPGANFLHIPMGTFGLCDYLNQRKIPAKILNLALYDERDMASLIDHHIEQFRPTHVGLILHWQETAEGGIWVAQHIKSKTNPAKIICGGFTAGYFGEALLKRYPSIDYVIKGDPERPMEFLLNGTKEQEIPNLIYKDGTDIQANEVSYFIDQETLSSISFSKLTYLFDHNVYIRAVEEKLWFPVFIGRGCIFSCDYCGGSRESFRLHSARAKPVSRSIAAIITDLKRLKEFTRKIYICYEIDQDYIKTLFKAMKEEKALIKTFRLNYGAWQLLDRQFLELYRELFIIDNQDKALFEISPEVYDDKSREVIKHHKTYSIEKLKGNLGLINDCLGTNIKINIFFSRYHGTAQTYAAIRDEILSIFRLKHDLFAKKYIGVNVCYDHLSTDVGSHYWESYVEKPRDPDTLISWERRLRDREQCSFPLDNLCVFIPKALSEQEIFRCELLVFMLKILERQSYELFHILFACLDELFIRALEEVITDQYSNRTENVFKSLDHCKLLLDLKKTVIRHESMLSRIPFIEDLTSLQIKKARHQHRPKQTGGSCDGTKRPRLNYAFISIHDHDYLDLPSFLERLQKEGPANLRHEKTVSVFLADEIMSMSYETYRMTIKVFERGLSLNQYYMLMRRKGIFDYSYHKKFLAKMFQNGVLY